MNDEPTAYEREPAKGRWWCFCCKLGFCRVVFWRNPACWIMRDPRAYWFWLTVYTVPLIILIEEIVRRG